MKKYIKLSLFLVFLFNAGVLFAAEERKQNFKMETFFPVPYVAYDSIEVSRELQMGLKNNATILIGGKENLEKALDVQTASISENKVLSLGNNGNITTGGSITLGQGTGQLIKANFSDVNITGNISGSTLTFDAADVANMQSMASISLYPDQVKTSSLPASSVCKNWAWVPFVLDGADCNNKKYYFGCVDSDKYVPSSCESETYHWSVDDKPVDVSPCTNPFTNKEIEENNYCRLISEPVVDGTSCEYEKGGDNKVCWVEYTKVDGSPATPATCGSQGAQRIYAAECI